MDNTNNKNSNKIFLIIIFLILILVLLVFCKFLRNTKYDIKDDIKEHLVIDENAKEYIVEKEFPQTKELPKTYEGSEILIFGSDDIKEQKVQVIYTCLPEVAVTDCMVEIPAISKFTNDNEASDSIIKSLDKNSEKYIEEDDEINVKIVSPNKSKKDNKYKISRIFRYFNIHG